jgi:hypothetical protein
MGGIYSPHGISASIIHSLQTTMLDPFSNWISLPSVPRRYRSGY